LGDFGEVASTRSEALSEIISQRIAQLENGDRFNLREILCGEWPDGQGAPRQLGKDF
jgi:hypothetical protein